MILELCYDLTNNLPVDGTPTLENFGYAGERKLVLEKAQGSCFKNLVKQQDISRKLMFYWRKMHCNSVRLQ